MESGGGLVGVVAFCDGVGLVGGGSKAIRVEVSGEGVYPQEGTKRGTFSACLRHVRWKHKVTCTNLQKATHDIIGDVTLFFK